MMLSYALHKATHCQTVLYSISAACARLPLLAVRN